jgi:hypothetical protein
MIFESQRLLRKSRFSLEIFVKSGQTMGSDSGTFSTRGMATAPTWREFSAASVETEKTFNLTEKSVPGGGRPKNN